MSKPAELSAALALGWSLLLTVALLSATILVGTLFGASNLAIVIAGPLELLLMWPATKFIARLYGGPDERQALALAPTPPLELLIAGSLGVIVHLPVGYLSALVERRFPTPPAELRAQLAMLLPSTTPMALGMLISVALVVPFIEELYFRGALFTALLRNNPAIVAIWTTSVGFALAHPKPRDWAPLFLVAVVLGVVRRFGASIWAGVALHAAFNATTLLFLFMTRPVDVKPEEATWLPAVIGALLTVSGVWLFARVSGRRLAEAGGR